MKASLKNILGLAALGMTLFATTVPTWAGYAFTPGVTIGSNQLGRFGKGSMVGARYSADIWQYIECSAIANFNPNDNLVECAARSSTGYLACHSQDPKLQDRLQGMTDSSFISFTVDGSGNCTDIRIYQGSEHLK